MALRVGSYHDLEAALRLDAAFLAVLVVFLVVVVVFLVALFFLAVLAVFFAVVRPFFGVSLSCSAMIATTSAYVSFVGSAFCSLVSL